MTREDIIKMAEDCGIPEFENNESQADNILRFAALVAEAERNKLAQWMIQHGYATGHGDTVEDLLQELDWQIVENWTRAMVNGVKAEREACAKVCEWKTGVQHVDAAIETCAAAIRARGQDPMPLFDDWPGGWKK